jgi:hypothetical protein
MYRETETNDRNTQKTRFSPYIQQKIYPIEAFIGG